MIAVPVLIVLGGAMIVAARLQLVAAPWLEAPGWIALAVGLGVGTLQTARLAKSRRDIRASSDKDVSKKP